MRGKELCNFLLNGIIRITPACAGKSPVFLHPRLGHWDHPRVCGEKMQFGTGSNSAEGSPPRVRGKGQCKDCLVNDIMDHPRVCGEKQRGLPAAERCRRITPACAGKRCSHPVRCRNLRDHPRVCGEKLLAEVAAGHLSGSPPRVRGKGLTTILGKTSNRITPACAGKSICPQCRLKATQDHPRVCGEKRL